MTPLADRPNKGFLLDFEMLKRLFLAAEGNAEIIASWRRLRAGYHHVGQHNLREIIEELRVVSGRGQHLFYVRDNVLHFPVGRMHAQHGRVAARGRS